MPQTFRPLNDRVLVRQLPADDQSRGGILLPEQAKEKPLVGEVIATSSELVSAGQTVMFGKYAGTQIKLNGETHLVIPADDLLGVLAD